MRQFLQRLLFAAALLTGGVLAAAERIPPAPARHFNDYAGVVTSQAAESLDQQLAQYERDSSNQLLVAIFPTMESDSSVEDYTVRVAQAWKVGQKEKNNGAVLFIFIAEHKLYLQVGYGLEPKLTDAISSQIIRNELRPAFRAGDYDGGLSAAVTAMIAATKGEYKGTGRTQAESRSSGGTPLSTVFVALFIIAIIIINAIRRARHPGLYVNPRRGGGIFWGGGGSGGGWTGGGSSGGGGGFSGGGGSFGGGGAGGSW